MTCPDIASSFPIFFFLPVFQSLKFLYSFENVRQSMIVIFYLFLSIQHSYKHIDFFSILVFSSFFFLFSYSLSRTHIPRSSSDFCLKFTVQRTMDSFLSFFLSFFQIEKCREYSKVASRSEIKTNMNLHVRNNVRGIRNVI